MKNLGGKQWLLCAGMINSRAQQRPPPCKGGIPKILGHPHHQTPAHAPGFFVAGGVDMAVAEKTRPRPCYRPCA